jgi:hypothetical protein
VYYLKAYATNTAGTIYGNEITFTTSGAIGDVCFGGYVAYILMPGDPGYDPNIPHGIIAAPNDQSNSQWGCYGTPISGADGTELGTGYQNTLDIVAGCSTAGIAARICSDLVLGGYSDWFLPSLDELYKLYLNRVAIGMPVGVVYYWSSSEYDNNNAWAIEFQVGPSYYVEKFEQTRVRAVRAF